MKTNQYQSKCEDCGIEKNQADFYRKADKKTGRVRWDRTCIVCRCEQRKNRYRSKRRVNHHPIKQVAPKRIIEPQDSNYGRTFETDVSTAVHTRHVNKVDFNDIEEFYGKKITYNERYELVQRFNEFVTILCEGYSEITGSHVYVRKD